MDKLQDTQQVEYYVRCPKCDKLLMQVVAIESCKIKCWNCNRKYYINVKDGNLSIKLISKSKTEE